MHLNEVGLKNQKRCFLNNILACDGGELAVCIFDLPELNLSGSSCAVMSKTN